MRASRFALLGVVGNLFLERFSIKIQLGVLRCTPFVSVSIMVLSARGTRLRLDECSSSLNSLLHLGTAMSRLFSRSVTLLSRFTIIPYLWVVLLVVGTFCLVWTVLIRVVRVLLVFSLPR